jgi:hypothetical protein
MTASIPGSVNIPLRWRATRRKYVKVDIAQDMQHTIVIIMIVSDRMANPRAGFANGLSDTG